ncbi:undecaprenyldiphospho-muramoylpentapeptide beta-N-acetylglucosaminyltransferase [Myxococcota bacterium]|nr:undecaprenyldiphospho-muramoylpentapeptide beta-N-acetylglucosaminyltransferase [Myxococcota bacterium]MBU1537658.1 undecaprenyldiphospho-muramoylpentapeptide beta-N-acetylglucosaminyltransferase [Myxococcota bacterium]
MAQNKAKKNLVVAIAGGGTGGHLYPGLALAEAFLEEGASVHFVGSKQGIEARVIPREGLPLHFIPVRGIKRMGPLTRILGLLILPAAFFKCLYLLLKIKPDLVVGVGGYASGPFVMTAAFFRYKTAILEQNTIPGVTNRMLGKAVKKIYLSFDEAGKHFPKEKLVHAGNPVRKGIRDQILGAKSANTVAGKNLLVFGGSQGAHTINITMAAAAPLLAGMGVTIRHQTGPKDTQEVSEAYEKAGVSAEVSEYIYDMATAYQWADIIVCRAGATTIAELTIAARPAILIPFPYATDNHQEENALSLERDGAGVCIAERDLSAEILAKKVEAILGDPQAMARMGENMTKRSRPRAAEEIRDNMKTLLGGAPLTQEKKAHG